MSRSYKKHPFYTDGIPGTTKEFKKFANKKVRNTKELPDGGAYKKTFESYNIHDYANRETWEEAKAAWEREEKGYTKKRYPTLKDFYRFWSKRHRTK